jgi:hypothetical protein
VPPSPTPTSSWDAPSPPPAPPSREPIPADATLKTTVAPESPPPASPPAVVAPAPVLSTEVLTPRPRDIVHAGEEHPPDEHGRPWVKAGVAAAAGLAVLRLLRGRR